jgi:hypothetical protein
MANNVGAAVPAPNSSKSTESSKSTGRMVAEVRDALTLLDYAVAAGVKTKDGLAIAADIVTKIKMAAAKLGLLESVSGTTGELSPEEWIAFELAYYDLATALSPVTAETLRNTTGVPYEYRSWWQQIRGDSPAIRFTRVLWIVTIAFAVIVLGSNWYLGVKSEEPNTGTYLAWRVIIELATPWVYGGLGACVFLLRSAHVFIYQRSFDTRRKPEYFNRILLGAVAGGAIMLFVSQIAGDGGTTIQLSAAALGFLAGYNTDFLFSTIERVMAALLPKVGIDSVQKAKASTQPVDINDLAQRMDSAKGADKELYKALLAQLTGARASPRG